MKNTLTRITRMSGKAVALMITAAFFLASNVQAQNAKPFVIPELQSWEGGNGSVAIKRVVASGTTESVAKQFAQDWQTMFGQTLEVVKKGGKQKGDITLTINRKIAGTKEAYSINASENQFMVAAKTAEGLFWATRTLLQIAEQQQNHEIPCGKIFDQPQYEMRGFMLDCGRKFFPMSYLRNLAKCMSYYKMNTLQIHLNDNGFKQYFENDWNKTQAAFRLESEYFPELTAKDGHYTKAEFRAFQKEAAAMGVEVIPEIDVPAHSLAFSQYRPSLGSKEFGMDHLDLFNPELYPFLDSLFTEYLSGKDPVFVGPRVNIGTDEYSNARQDVVEKFRELTDRYLKFVQKHGKQAACWGALTHAKGKTPVTSDNVIMNCWYNGYAQPDSMKTLGYKLVSIPDGAVYIVPAAGYYYDYLNCQWLYNSWTPAHIGNKTFEEQDPSILGGMFAVWNDHPGNGITVRDVHDRVMPALQTLSTKCWRGAQTSTPYDEFNAKRTALSEAPGVDLLGQKAAVSFAQLPAGQKLTDLSGAGYGYEVSFQLQGKSEAKGTVLTRDDECTFYLADPQSGRLGFERENYLITFNYTVRDGANDKIAIRMTNKETILLVNGKEKERLDRMTLYTTTDKGANPYLQSCHQHWTPSVFPASQKSVMYYQRTLVFPLAETGQFKSTITDFNVSKF